MEEGLSIGDTVREIGDNHKGCVVSLDLKRNRAYIQWHKGYCTWVHWHRIIIEKDA